jgi:hypothetical protein
VFYFDNLIRSGKTFVVPKEREVYYSAKESSDLDDPKQLEEVKKLLMRRAMYAIPVVLALQTSMNSVQRLYNKGMLTDDVYDNVKEMKAFCDQEWPDVQMEADDLVEGWGAHIWQEAMRFHQVYYPYYHTAFSHGRWINLQMIQSHNEQKVAQQAPPERMSAEKRQVNIAITRMCIWVFLICGLLC